MSGGMGLLVVQRKHSSCSKNRVQGNGFISDLVRAVANAKGKHISRQKGKATHVSGLFC